MGLSVTERNFCMPFRRRLFLKLALCCARPIAELAVMGAEGAVEILFRKELRAAPKRRDELVEEYETLFMNPYIAAARGFIDEVIRPEDTRKRILAALEMLEKKERTTPWKKHGNIPL